MSAEMKNQGKRQPWAKDDAGPLHDALVALSDTLEPEEGPVVLAWAVGPLAAALTKALAERGHHVAPIATAKDLS